MRWPGAVMAAVALCTFAPAGAAAASTPAPATISAHRHPSARIATDFPSPRISAPLPPRVARFSSGVSGSSYNWAGYAQSAPTGTFSAVTGTFQVPTVENSSDSEEFSAQWLGIGGYSDGTLIQAGVEADNLQGTAFYRAWTEVLPQDEHPLSMKIDAGDTIRVTIAETAKNSWTMTVADMSTGAESSRKVHYKSSGASAEAILERPCIESPCNSLSDLANLAPTTAVTFDQLLTSTSRPSSSPTYEPFMVSPADATLQDIVMLDDNGDVIATPSNADSEGDGFTVADGSSVPPAPSS